MEQEEVSGRQQEGTPQSQMLGCWEPKSEVEAGGSMAPTPHENTTQLSEITDFAFGDRMEGARRSCEGKDERRMIALLQVPQGGKAQPRQGPGDKGRAGGVRGVAEGARILSGRCGVGTSALMRGEHRVASVKDPSTGGVVRTLRTWTEPSWRPSCQRLNVCPSMSGAECGLQLGHWDAVTA